MMSKTIRLFRVIMPVNDIAAATKFYRALFAEEGFRVSAGRHYFDCGGVILALYDAKADGDTKAVHANGDHVYFAVPDLEAVHQRAQQLDALSNATGDGNLPMGQIARRPWGEVSFYMHDSSGNPLCFVDAQSLYRGPNA